VFLKNVAFTLYWNAADLDETIPSASDSNGIKTYFSTSASGMDSTVTTVRELEQKNRERGLSGVTGIPLDYFKGLVTGLLRMIHERE
jgi:ubiquitin-protein ligase E3 C